MTKNLKQICRFLPFGSEEHNRIGKFEPFYKAFLKDMKKFQKQISDADNETDRKELREITDIFLRDFTKHKEEWDKRFRQYLGVDIKSNRYYIFPNRVNNKSFPDFIKLFHRDFTVKRVYALDSRRNHTIYKFEKNSLSILCRSLIGFQLGGHGKKVTVGVIGISWIFCLLKFYDAIDIDWAIAEEVLEDMFMKDISFFESTANMVCNKIQSPVKEKKERPKGLKYKSKKNKINPEDIKAYLIIHGAVETKKYFAKEYNVTERTIHNIMKANNMTRAYKTNKTKQL